MKVLHCSLFLAFLATACMRYEPQDPSQLPKSPAANQALVPCHDGARLDLELAGAIEGDFSWADGSFQCESMRRPDDEGARLRFVADVEGSHLALIVAIPDLDRGKAGRELTSNLTLYVEGKAVFFGTQGNESCWADIGSQDLIEDARYRIDGIVYCIAPLNEINGSSSVTIVDLAFSSHVDWNAT